MPWALHVYADVIGSCTSKSVPAQMDDLCDLMAVGSHVNAPTIANTFNSTNVLNKQTSHSIW